MLLWVIPLYTVHSPLFNWTLPKHTPSTTSAHHSGGIQRAPSSMRLWNFRKSSPTWRLKLCITPKQEVNLWFDLALVSEAVCQDQQGHLKVYISIQSSAAQVSPWECYWDL